MSTLLGTPRPWSEVRAELRSQAQREAESRRLALASCRLLLAAFGDSPEAEGIRAAHQDAVRHLDEHTRARYFRNDAVRLAQQAVELEARRS